MNGFDSAKVIQDSLNETIKNAVLDGVAKTNVEEFLQHVGKCIESGALKIELVGFDEYSKKLNLSVQTSGTYACVDIHIGNVFVIQKLIKFLMKELGNAI